MVDISGTPREFLVEGTTFAPEGSVIPADDKSSAEVRSEPLLRLAEISAICNDSKIIYHAVCLKVYQVPSCTDSFIG